MKAASLTTWIGMSGLLVAGCATMHPDFEQDFNTEYVGIEYQNESPSHDVWMKLAASRYGCDTLAIRRTVRGWTDMGVGATPCEIAAGIPPGSIRGFKTEKGYREEWHYGSGARTMTIHFEGATTRTLVSTFVTRY
jgi:hypothetical protein